LETARRLRRIRPDIECARAFRGRVRASPRIYNCRNLLMPSPAARPPTPSRPSPRPPAIPAALAGAAQESSARPGRGREA
jgi:hypothetical protein